MDDTPFDISEAPMSGRRARLALIFCALTLASACGGDDDSDRPSVSEISASLTAEGSVLPADPDPEQADCVAGLLERSDISDEALVALVEQDTDYQGSDEDAEALDAIGTKITSECFGDEPSPF